MNNAGLILTAPTSAIRPTSHVCLCDRLAPYGLLCRKCHWRIMTPPPLHGTPEPVDRHSQAPAHGRCGTFEALYSPREGRLQALARVRRFDAAQAANAAREAAPVDSDPVAYNLRD